MAVARLSLTDFRNHTDLLICPAARFIVLHGPNGAGKTNILEAVSLLVPGRGLRRAALSEMIRSDGSGGFAISAEVEGMAIGTGVDPTAPDRRLVKLNGSRATINNLAECLAVIWLTPAMDRLFVDAAAARRRFLDRLVLALEPQHARYSAAYEKAVQQRNKLLSHSGTPDAKWLDALETQMAESGAEIIGARQRTMNALSTELLSADDRPFAVPTIALDPAEAATTNELREAWQAGRRRDARAGRTLIGPHRTDLFVRNRASGQSASRSSTGEQKALLLSLILAHAAMVGEKRGSPPILLLDEIAAHLDPVRRASLFDRLAATGAQVWMTGTEPDLFRGIGASAQLVAVGG